jgi:hypothetical protein
MIEAGNGISRSDRMSGPLRVLVFSLIAFGILLRVLLANYRLPLNVDDVYILDRALRLFVEGPNLHWFHYPSLYIYAAALSEGTLFSVRWLLGLSPTPDAFADWYFSDPRTAYLAARVWSVVAGVATLSIVYKTGVVLASPLAGLWAAIFLAVSPTHIFYSAIAKPDAAMVLAMQVAGLLAVRYIREQRRGLPWGPALLGGLAATLKYPGGAAWFAAPVAMFLSTASFRRNIFARLRDFAALGAAAILVFLIGTPFVLVEPEQFRHDLVGLFRLAAQELPGMEGVTPWGMYLGDALPHSLSLPILGLSAWGLLTLLRRDWRSTIIVLVPTAVYAVPIFSASLAQFGYILPLLPIVCLCAGAGFEALRSYLPGGIGSRSTFQVALAILCIASPLSVSICNQVQAQRLTAQELTENWVREHLPAGVSLLGTATGMTLPMTPERLDKLLADATRARTTGGARIRFLQRTTPSGTGYDFYDMDAYEPTSQTGELRLSEYDPEWITKNGFQYVIESERNVRRFFLSPDRYPLPFRFEKWLVGHGELIFTTHPGSRGFSDWRDDPERVRALEPLCGFGGGELRIYRIKDGVAR